MRHLKHLFALPSLLLRGALAYSTLSDESLEALPSPGNNFDINDGYLLAPILRPRVPGTPGSEAVLAHFVTFFQRHLREWKLDFQNSTSTTPVSDGKEVPFVNLIATRDPPWIDQEGEVGRLALVAHYDSKLEPEGFIGAVDSAAPCAMLLHTARSIDGALTKKWETMMANVEGSGFDGMEDHKGVQILLLDGEEAFKTWTSTDSLYGARSLAEEWEATMHPAWSTYSSPIASIDLFVLLDLLGAANPLVPSYFKTTHWAYKHMADVEKRLRDLGRFKSSPNHASKRFSEQARAQEPMFLRESAKTDADRWMGGLIGDDHEPFLARGVEILHIIPSPFPFVWHRIDDDGEHLDIDTVEDWALLTTAFAAEWLELEGFFDTSSQTSHNSRRAVDDDKTEL
jgi:hypothetical protein